MAGANLLHPTSLRDAGVPGEQRSRSLQGLLQPVFHAFPSAPAHHSSQHRLLDHQFLPAPHGSIRAGGKQLRRVLRFLERNQCLLRLTDHDWRDRRIHRHPADLAEPPQELGRPGKLAAVLPTPTGGSSTALPSKPASRIRRHRMPFRNHHLGGEDHAGVPLRSRPVLLQDLAVAPDAETDRRPVPAAAPGRRAARTPLPATTLRTSTIERIPDPASVGLDGVWEEEWQKAVFAAAVERSATRPALNSSRCSTSTCCATGL